MDLKSLLRAKGAPPLTQVDVGPPDETDGYPIQRVRPESAEPMCQKRPEKEYMCSLCEKEKVMPPVTRCKPCNRLYEHVRKAAKKPMGQDYIELWDNMDEDKKIQFIRSAKDLTGRNLEAQLQIFVEKMFKHYPAHWRKMFCPSREDQSNLKAEENRREKRKMS